MRDFLTRNLEPLIWIWCGISVASSVVAGVALMRINSFLFNGYTLMAGLAVGLGGIALTLVLTGLFFNLLDTRQFTKHAAMSLHRSRQEGRR